MGVPHRSASEPSCNFDTLSLRVFDLSVFRCDRGAEALAREVGPCWYCGSALPWYVGDANIKIGRLGGAGGRGGWYC